MSATGNSSAVAESTIIASDRGGSGRRHIRFAGLLIGGALAGKVLGFVREIAFARLLGASMMADAFRAGLTGALLPVAPLQGDIVPAVLIPLHKKWDSEGSAACLFASLTTGLVLLAAAIALIIELFADRWIGLIAGGFGPEAHELARKFMQVMALAVPAVVFVVCLSSIELSLGRSRITSIRASIQNLGLMVGISLTTWGGDPILIAWSFTVAYTVTAVWGSCTLVREGALDFRQVRPRAVIACCGEFIRRIRFLLIQPLADQGNIWLERLLGSASGVGVLASLDYARTLTECALYLISQPIGYVILGRGHNDAAGMRRQVEALSRPLIAIAIPASTFLFLYATDIVSIVFARGAFDHQAVLLTAATVRGSAVGLWASTLGWILIRAVNASGRNTTAAGIVGSAYVVNALLNLYLVLRLGSLGLGLGEAARGLFLLAGTAVALRCGGLLLKIVAQTLPSGLVLMALHGGLLAGHEPGAVRLGYGLLLCLSVMLPTFVCVSPTIAGRMFTLACDRLQTVRIRLLRGL